MSSVDIETRARAEHPEELRLWLRMMATTQRVESKLRSGLRVEFGTTLPRFDLMAQLERVPEGLLMSELSRRMMVTGGNVTTITDRLEAEGLVERTAVDGDRRAYQVRLTPVGHKHFEVMAKALEGWVVNALAGLSSGEIRALYGLLGKIKQRLLEAE